MNRPTAFECLESRTMMSATLFSTAVATDRMHIRQDFVKLNCDLYADAGKLMTDNAVLRADHLHQNTTLQPLVAKFRGDVYSFGLVLRGDRLTEAGNVIADEQVVVKDLQKIFADRKNPTALAADKAQLITDRVKTQTAMVAGLTQRLADRETETATLQADAQAILTALPTSGANAQLTADVTQWLGDKGAALAKITADVAKIAADRSQLITDLNAMNV